MNKLLAIGAIVSLVLGLWMMIRDPGHIPLLDANRTILAESEVDGYCAGAAFMDSRGRGDQGMVDNCKEDRPAMSTDYNPSVVASSFCQAVRDKGYDMAITDCVTILISNRYWPTRAGALTSSWNKRFPYPGDALTVAEADTDSRTGARDETNRNIGGYGTP